MNLTIKRELITGKNHEINYGLINNKKITFLTGYARSGKDTLGKLLVDNHSFKRISFGDVLKQDLDTYMVEDVFNDLKNKGISIQKEDINFLNPKTIEIKEILRPYMIWFGEEMKKINGIHHWTNRAFSQIGDNNKVVITDVRRLNELEPSYNEVKIKNNFKSILIHINQFGLTDNDVLTIETIRKAHEDWIVDKVVYVDSRIPDVEDKRKKHMNNHMLELLKDFQDFFV